MAGAQIYNYSVVILARPLGGNDRDRSGCVIGRSSIAHNCTISHAMPVVGIISPYPLLVEADVERGTYIYP